jgi:hypothetical protein
VLRPAVGVEVSKGVKVPPLKVPHSAEIVPVIPVRVTESLYILNVPALLSDSVERPIKIVISAFFMVFVYTVFFGCCVV